MGKKTKKTLVSESTVKRMQRLAGMIEDDEDLEIINESFDTTSGPSAPSAPSAGPGRSEEVVQENDEEDYDMDDDEGDEFEEDDEDYSLDDDTSDDFDAVPESPVESPVGGGMGGDMNVAKALETLAKALGFDVEIDGSDGSDMGGMGDELPMDSESSMEDMGGEFGDDSLDDEQNKMLAEIFAKTSKQIMSKIKSKKK